MTYLRLGPRTHALLETVGIHTQEDLERLGAVAAWKKLKATFPQQANEDLLFALHGVLVGCCWSTFSPEQKSTLRREAELG